MKDAYNHRLRLVESARQRGIKATAWLFATTAPTQCSDTANVGNVLDFSYGFNR